MSRVFQLFFSSKISHAEDHSFIVVFTCSVNQPTHQGVTLHDKKMVVLPAPPAPVVNLKTNPLIEEQESNKNGTAFQALFSSSTAMATVSFPKKHLLLTYPNSELYFSGQKVFASKWIYGKSIILFFRSSHHHGHSRQWPVSKTAFHFHFGVKIAVLAHHLLFTVFSIHLRKIYLISSYQTKEASISSLVHDIKRR